MYGDSGRAPKVKDEDLSSRIAAAQRELSATTA